MKDSVTRLIEKDYFTKIDEFALLPEFLQEPDIQIKLLA